MLLQRDFWTASVFVTIFLVVSATAQQYRDIIYSHTIYVDPKRGTNNASCLSPSTNPCKNISYAFQYRNNSTQYFLQSGTHYLNSTASDDPFTGLTDIAITGNDTIVICFTNNAGLGFNGVRNILISSVTFINCSAIQNSTSRNYSAPSFTLSQTKVALYFNNCESLAMQNVRVTKSPGAIGVVIYNTNGSNTFNNCTLTENDGYSNDPYPGGGGMYIEFSYCLPGQNSCANGSLNSYTDRNKNSTYLFSDCHFLNNTAVAMHQNTSFMSPHNQNHVAFSHGGGLSIFFKADAGNNTFKFSNCFFERNVAEYGAGMFIEFHDTSGGNTVIINESQFIDNNCKSFAGGGLGVGHHVYERSSVENRGNKLEVHSTAIHSNSADSGGGMCISPSRQNAPDSELFTVLLQDTHFLLNTARYGAALRVNLFGLIVAGSKPNITVIDCNYFGNAIYSPDPYIQPYEVGLGVVYITEVDVSFTNSNWVYNDGGALVMVGSSIYFKNSTDFALNTGYNGGAIALLGSSRIIVDRKTQLVFHDNLANEGGAIYNKYTDRNDFGDSSACFITHTDPFITPDNWETQFTFRGNRDSRGWNAIYTTSILPCALGSGVKRKESVKKIFCWNNWTYNGTKNCSDYIRTGPGKIVNENNHSVVPPISSAVTAYPGEPIQLFLTAEDDLNHAQPIVYAATISNSSKYNYNGGAKIDPYYAYVSQNTLKVYQYNNNTWNSTTLIYLDEVGDRAWHVELNVSLAECPPGLLLSNVSCDQHDEEKSCSVCKCNTTTNYRETVHCNSEYNASLASGYWIGQHNGTRCFNKTCFLVGVCAPGFCRIDNSGFIVLPKKGLNEDICGVKNRTGMLCGECIPGYGPALNSELYNCVPCNDSTKGYVTKHVTYYILSQYVPLFLMFLALIVFNIKLTTGPANAFILYSQVISSTFDLDAGGRIPLRSTIPNYHNYELAYKFPYGIFNLKFFEQLIPAKYLCLGENFNVLDVMLLEYIVAFFPLLMIIVILIVYKITSFSGCCTGHARETLPDHPVRRNTQSHWVKICKIGDAVLPAFASFVLLSYTKFSLTSSYLSVSQKLWDASGNDVGLHRVFYAGQYSSDDKDYIVRYYLPSVFVFSTFVAIPPLLLLDYPLWFFEEKIIQKFTFLKRYYPKVKIHILLDTFQGCFKNRWRCFAGLYFIFRLIINVTFINAYIVEQYLLQGIYCTVLAILIAYLKPYRFSYHLFNYVDSLIFLNLAIINQISFYLYATTRNGTKPHVIVFAIQYILVFAPLVYMLSYMVWCILPIPNVRLRVREWFTHKKRSQQMENLIRDGISATPEPTDDEIDWDRAREVNQYSPILFDAEDEKKTDSCERRTASTNQASGVRSDSGLTSYGSTDNSSTTAVSFDTATH